MNRDEAFTRILAELPEFGPSWKDYLEDWDGEEPGITIDFSVFVDFAYTVMGDAKNEVEIQKIAMLVEEFICNGDDDVSYGATIGFLEGLTNRVLNAEPAGWGLFLKNAGKETRSWLKALDKFWGTRTPKVKQFSFPRLSGIWKRLKKT